MMEMRSLDAIHVIFQDHSTRVFMGEEVQDQRPEAGGNPIAFDESVRLGRPFRRQVSLPWPISH